MDAHDQNAPPHSPPPPAPSGEYVIPIAILPSNYCHESSNQSTSSDEPVPPVAGVDIPCQGGCSERSLVETDPVLVPADQKPVVDAVSPVGDENVENVQAEGEEDGSRSPGGSRLPPGCFVQEAVCGVLYEERLVSTGSNLKEEDGGTENLETVGVLTPLSVKETSGPPHGEVSSRGSGIQKPATLALPPPPPHPSLPSPLSPGDSIYQIKWLRLGEDEQGRPVTLPIVLQNQNGPCPLISLANVLLLTRRLRLAPGIEYQAGENLMAQLASLLLESIPREVSEEQLRNYEQNVQDALAILPKLQTGLDINVRFSGPRQYEFTQDTLVFDVLDVPLVHGWLVESNDPAKLIIDKCASYNHLVEYIINAKQTPPQNPEEVLHAEDWLERTSAQLTYAGLIALVECLEPNALAVLFRNNHFSTVIKHNDQIYALVTDQGYATETSCVWEQISNIEGDTDFFDAKFQLRAPKEPLSPTSSQQMDVDLQLALSLQEQEDTAAALIESPVNQPTQPVTDLAQVPSENAVDLSDFELAKRLQAEEDRLAQHRVQANKVPRSEAYPQGKMISVLPESQSAQNFLEHEREHKESRSRGLPTSTSTLIAPPAPPGHPDPREGHGSARSVPLRRGHSAATEGESKTKNCVIS